MLYNFCFDLMRSRGLRGREYFEYVIYKMVDKQVLKKEGNIRYPGKKCYIRRLPIPFEDLNLETFENVNLL